MNGPPCLILTWFDGPSRDVLLELASQRASSVDHGRVIDIFPRFPITPSTGMSRRKRPQARQAECMKPPVLSLAATCVIGD